MQPSPAYLNSEEHWFDFNMTTPLLYQGSPSHSKWVTRSVTVSSWFQGNHSIHAISLHFSHPVSLKVTIFSRFIILLLRYSSIRSSYDLGTCSWRSALDTTLCDKVCHLTCNRSVVFSGYSGFLRHDITEIWC